MAIYTGEEINDLEVVVSMLSCCALQRNNNTSIESIVFLRIRKRSSLCGFDWEESPEKGWGNGKKYYELKAEFASLSVCVSVCVCVCVCVFVCEKLTALMSLQSFPRYRRNVNLLLKKKLKVQDF